MQDCLTQAPRPIVCHFGRLGLHTIPSQSYASEVMGSLYTRWGQVLSGIARYMDCMHKIAPRTKERVMAVSDSCGLRAKDKLVLMWWITPIKENKMSRGDQRQA